MPVRYCLCPVSNEQLEIATCLDFATHYTGQFDRAAGRRRMCNFRYPYLKRTFSHADARPQGLSATMATHCLRKSWLDARVDYAIYPGEQMAAGSGTAWHAWLETENEAGVVAEQRLWHTLPSGRVLSGQLDRLVPVLPGNCLVPEGQWPQDETDHVWLVEDYKRKEDERIFRHAPPYYVLQLNIYRLFVERGSVVRETGELIRGRIAGLYLLPSSHSEQGEVVRVPQFPLDEVASYLEECLDYWQRAEELGELPPRDDDPDDPNNHFCVRYCQQRTRCRQHGGAPYHPGEALVGAKREGKKASDGRPGDSV